MRPEKILVGEGKILLADKIIYLAVEFHRLAEADFKEFEKRTKAVLSRRQTALRCILAGHTDGFPRFAKPRVCTP